MAKKKREFAFDADVIAVCVCEFHFSRPAID